MYSFLEQMNVRIDYLKFLVSMDFDRAQELTKPMTEWVNSPESPLDNKRSFEITVLGPTKDTAGKSRYVIEVWGPNTLSILPFIPTWLWAHLSRVDYREPLLHTNEDALAAFCQKWSMSDKGSRNISTLNTKARAKTNRRDVGGKGIVFGSRKSNSHTVAYKRGSEYPAIESRIEKSRAADLGMTMLNMLMEEGHAPIDRILLDLANKAARAERYRCIGQMDIHAWENAMQQALGEQATMQAALEWKETEEEREFWENLSPEEQEQWQKDGFVPTAMLKPKLRG